MVNNKNKYIYIPLIIIVILLMTLFFTKALKPWINQAVYSKIQAGDNGFDIPKKFTELDIRQVKNKIENGDSFFLYTGRDTCRYCRELIPVLNKIYSELEIELYYLDSEYTEVDEQIQEFRTEYGIEFVPSLIKFNGKGYKTIDLNLLYKDHTYNYSLLYEEIKKMR